VAFPPLLDWLASLGNLSLIVSATYDRLLEEQLERAGRKYVIVSHVLRSDEGREDGKVLVLRPGLPPEFCAANLLCFAPDELVLYKPLGSPFLHDGLDPNLYIDTVVVTETDHALFLQRLDSSETGVPNPLRIRFRRSPLLFLGYTMDVWQYRLMMLIFQSAGRQGRNASMLAVRIPDAKIEELAWNRLNTNLIRMDPNQFARSAQALNTAAE
jgi:SIR2-like domain